MLISAGFDAAQGDPLGGCQVTPEGYAHLTHLLMGLAGGRIILILEVTLLMSLPWWEGHLEELAISLRTVAKISFEYTWDSCPNEIFFSRQGFSV